MNSKIKVIFVLPSLRAGGAERVMSYVASNLNKDIFDASLLITGSNKDQSYTINKNTPVHFLKKSRVKYALPAIAMHLFRQRPHIVVGAIGHINLALAILAIFFGKIKFIGRQTTVVGAYQKSRIKSSKKITIPDFRPITLDKIICQSKDMKNDLIINFNYPEHKIITINNPVTNKFKLKDSIVTSNTVTQLITVGSLTKVKGHKRIINILSKLKNPFHYTIIGDGSEKGAIFEYAKKLNLLNHITHIPFTDKVEDYLAQSDLFLCGSFVEGFPNALLESCAVGTPVLAFNAPGGLNEIIVDGVNGYLAKDETEFILQLKTSMNKSWDSKIIRQSVMSKYNEELILKEYENLFLSFYENDSAILKNN